MKSTHSIPLACVTALVTCAVMGVVTGLMIAQFDLFPFVATLAMQLVIRGLATALSGGASFPVAVSAFTKIGLGKVFGVVPIPALILLVLAVIAYILMHWTKFGRYVYAIGGNRDAAIASGVNVYWVTVWTYVISGIFTGVAALIMTAKINATHAEYWYRIRNRRHCGLCNWWNIFCGRCIDHSGYSCGYHYHRSYL